MSNANKQDAGGLPELPTGDVAFREDCLSKWQYAHSDAQMRAYGEQCRAASGIPSVLDLKKMELAVTAALFNYEAGDSISERLKQTAQLLRALSRGVPEGE